MGQVTRASGRWAIGVASTSPQPGNATAPVKWDLQAGTVTPIDLKPGQPVARGPAEKKADGVSVTAVNAAGDIVISGPQDVLMRRGQALRLPAPATGGDAHPVAVNAAGTRVAGSIRFEDVTTSRQPRPVVWEC